MNTPLLKALMVFVQVDPEGIELGGAASLVTAIPARNGPVSLQEHIAHLLGTDFHRFQWKLPAILADVLQVKLWEVDTLCYIAFWPPDLVTAYRAANTAALRGQVIVKRITQFIADYED